METRASYVLVGAFVLLMLAAAGLFVVWLGRYQAEETFAYYDIYFGESVAGLQVGGAVRYQGVEVGRVQDIRIDPNDIQRVKVRVRVDRGTPIRQDATATLELQGITGLVFVQIKAGSNEALMLPERAEEPIPVIPSRPSLTAQIIEGAPNLLAQATALMQQAQEILNADNRRAFSETLRNVRDLTEMIVDYSRRLDGLLANGHQLTSEAQQAIVEYRALATSLRTQVDGLGGDAGEALKKVQQAADGFARVSRHLDGMIEDNRQGVSDFSGTGLYEFTQLMIEARVLVESLTRVSQQLERDPARFLFGDRQKGFEIER
jgi:phospholipid/cholesterol/gamma-HCH transport system substrate-binding protein